MELNKPYFELSLITFTGLQLCQKPMKVKHDIGIGTILAERSLHIHVLIFPVTAHIHF